MVPKPANVTIGKHLCQAEFETG